jgi:hypothetical protein
MELASIGTDLLASCDDSSQSSPPEVVREEPKQAANRAGPSTLRHEWCPPQGSGVESANVVLHDGYGDRADQR